MTVKISKQVFKGFFYTYPQVGWLFYGSGCLHALRVYNCDDDVKRVCLLFITTYTLLGDGLAQDKKNNKTSILVKTFSYSLYFNNMYIVSEFSIWTYLYKYLSLYTPYIQTYLQHNCFSHWSDKGDLLFVGLFEWPLLATLHIPKYSEHSSVIWR